MNSRILTQEQLSTLSDELINISEGLARQQNPNLLVAWDGNVGSRQAIADQFNNALNTNAMKISVYNLDIIPTPNSNIPNEVKNQIKEAAYSGRLSNLFFSDNTDGFEKEASKYSGYTAKNYSPGLFSNKNESISSSHAKKASFQEASLQSSRKHDDEFVIGRDENREPIYQLAHQMNDENFQRIYSSFAGNPRRDAEAERRFELLQIDYDRRHPTTKCTIS